VKLIINIDVDDLDKAIAFYEAGLGLRLDRLLFDGTVAEMAGAAVPIQLLYKPAGSPPAGASTAGRDYRRHWTPLHLDIEVGDVEAAAQRAERAGASPEGGVRSYEWGRIATFSDPFGHGFCLVQLAPGGYANAL
jgi:predicted enzyme related to lactoylglutathione lyase